MKKIPLLALAILLFSMPAASQTYYIFKNGNNYLYNNSGTPAVTTSFTKYAVWLSSGGALPTTNTNTNLRELRSFPTANSYLNGATNGTLSIGAQQSSWRIANNYLTYRNGSNYYYVKLNGSSLSVATGPNGNRFTPTTITVNPNVAAASNVTLSVSAAEGLTDGGIQLVPSIAGTYAPACTSAVVSGTTYYWDASTEASTSRPSQITDWSDATITWTVSGATVSSSHVLTFTSAPAGNVTVTMNVSKGGYTGSTQLVLTVADGAASEVATPDIAIAPSGASLEPSGSQAFSVPATLAVTTFSRPAHKTVGASGHTWYLTGTTLAATPPAGSSTTTEQALSSVSWTLTGDAGYASLSSSTANPTTVSRNSSTTATPRSLTLTATATYGSHAKSATATVAVLKTVVDIASLAVADMSVSVGGNAAATITYTPDAADKETYVQLAYSTADESIATVAADGTVTGVAPGQTTLTVGSTRQDGTAGLTRTATVTVTTPAAEPTYSRSGTTVTLASTTPGATIYYTLDGSVPTTASSSVSSGSSVTVAYGTTLRAFAQALPAYTASAVSSFTNGDGSSASSPYPVMSAADLAAIAGNPGRYYQVQADFEASSFTATASFTGTFDGNFHTISGLTQPLFTAVAGGTVKNVVLDNVSISRTGNVGALCNMASGTTRIYNCGVLASEASTVSGTAYVGGLVGSITGNTRIINCYSFATVSGGTHCGGILGYNPQATTSSNIGTYGLVMNCMFYGTVSGSTQSAPIYGGSNITNAGSTGINTYNYFRFPHSNPASNATYNCALAAEDRYLTRFEFFRGILNSNRELCAYYVHASATDTADIAKWVLDPAVAPYPVLKPWGKYPSIVNPDPERVWNPTAKTWQPRSEANAWEGRKLGTLTVTVQRGTYGSGTHDPITLTITDMDTLEGNWDYNYGKVQLPYYNDLFGGNYGEYVVTGWDVISVTKEGTAYTTQSITTTGDDRYNFCDRNNPQANIYGGSGNSLRVFAQGGYFPVPEGVTAITIRAHWGKAAYLSDQYYDIVHNTSYNRYNYAVAGARSTTYNGRTVRNTLANCMNDLTASPASVYDNAIVLVGNFHSNVEWTAITRLTTLMSVDGDGDNEPDYCIIHYQGGEQLSTGIRCDFVTHVGQGMAARVNGTTTMPNVTNFKHNGWFEITETALAHYTEFEMDHNNRVTAPLILNAGIYDQFITANGISTGLPYVILGGHAYLTAYTPGCHTNGANRTTHPPVNVLGGEYKEFYLTGPRPFTPTATYGSDTLAYANGGCFRLYAGAYMEGIRGNATTKFDHVLANQFYAGGINDLQPITGNLNTTIDHSMVGFYCGGPKFGNMAIGKTVTTSATGTTFGQYFGAGYGGTSFNRVKTQDAQVNTYTTSWFNDFTGNYLSNSTANGGILVDYDMEYFHYAGGLVTPDARFYTLYASFSVALCHQVTSTLTDCLVLGDFYGGGSIGKVDGNITSTLTSTEVRGNAYGAGYSATIPPCPVRPNTTPTFPAYNTTLGIFTPYVMPATTDYIWTHVNSLADNAAGTDGSNQIYTTEDLTTLGLASGSKVVITVDGASLIHHSVFGGGNASAVQNNTEVYVKGDSRVGENVFGGGNMAPVGSGSSNSATVTLSGNAEVMGNVYGGGNRGSVTGNSTVIIKE